MPRGIPSLLSFPREFLRLSWLGTIGAEPWPGTWRCSIPRGSGESRNILENSGKSQKKKIPTRSRVCGVPSAVASLNTPYRPADPDTDIMEKLASNPAFDYQFYFQEPVRIPGFFPIFFFPGIGFFWDSQSPIFRREWRKRSWKRTLEGP